jgi:hypothetical protein
MDKVSTSPQEFVDYRDRNHSFSAVAAYQPGREQVAILSYGMWQRRFEGDENIVGKNLVLDGANHVWTGLSRFFRISRI